MPEDAVLTIAGLLADSRAAHAKYRTLAGRISVDGKVQTPPNTVEAGAAIAQALSARITAQALDPQRTDPAWAVDQRLNKGVTSEALVNFLSKYLSPAEAISA